MAGDLEVAACGPSRRDALEAAGVRAVTLGPAGALDRKLGPLDDLTLARWQGATHVLASSEPGDPTAHSSVQMYLHDHGTRIGDRFGGTLWQIPPPPPVGPPAVFCLGLTKTATSTLAEALGMLGIRCYHWGGPPAWKAVVDALRAGELLTARLPDGWGAYADIGSLLSRYRLLDLQYPGSRFILTMRDEDAWINSRRRHVERNQQAHAAGRYHGTKLELDEDGWRAQWRGHVEGVREYFAGRDDLLELDLTRQPRWDELASFLGVDAPEAPFPAANVDGRPGSGRYPTFRRTPPEGERESHPPEAECPVCATVVPTFESAGTIHPRPDVRCPNCGSLERHRSMWIFLVDRTQMLERPARVLLVDADPFGTALGRTGQFEIECARPQLAHRPPTGALRRLFGRRPADLDLSSIGVDEDSYDLVVASHVLHQVSDDVAVLAELRRVIAPEGAVLVSVPTFGRPTVEEPGPTTADERRARFGDPLAARAYGNDGVLERRMVDAGFSVTVEDVPSSIGPYERERYRLGRPELLRWGRSAVGTVR
jgi:SAM-dependent methyltransferase